MKKTKNPIYVVKKGDTLNSIALEYNINPTILLLQNNCTPNMLKEGVVLYIG